jgi:GNAT superfamily N-acetyltransferase
MKYLITYIEKPLPNETQLLWKGISKNAKQMRGLRPGESFGFFVRDDAEYIKGGCSGYLFYGCLMVDLLWVDESIRNQGYGTSLMLAAENLARQKQCRFMTVNTMDFEAPKFYQKLGFFIEFEREGYEKDAIFYFLRKNLISNDK